MVIRNKLVVGIFSREAEDTYDWLKKLLLSPRFRPIVRDVRPVHISNDSSGGSWRFGQEVAQCSFAVLYHSQSRGRLNITNVTDSLYDEELRDLSRVLGREKVVVLVDDVENNDRTSWNRIRIEQPLIDEKAALLVVFYKNEKPVCSTGAEECASRADSYQRSADNENERKVESIRSLMRRGQTINMRCLILTVAGVVLIIVIIVLCVELDR